MSEPVKRQLLRICLQRSEVSVPSPSHLFIHKSTYPPTYLVSTLSSLSIHPFPTSAASLASSHSWFTGVVLVGDHACFGFMSRARVGRDPGDLSSYQVIALYLY